MQGLGEQVGLPGADAEHDGAALEVGDGGDRAVGEDEQRAVVGARGGHRRVDQVVAGCLGGDRRGGAGAAEVDGAVGEQGSGAGAVLVVVEDAALAERGQLLGEEVQAGEVVEGRVAAVDTDGDGHGGSPGIGGAGVRTVTGSDGDRLGR